MVYETCKIKKTLNNAILLFNNYYERDVNLLKVERNDKDKLKIYSLIEMTNYDENGDEYKSVIHIDFDITNYENYLISLINFAYNDFEYVNFLLEKIDNELKYIDEV